LVGGFEEGLDVGAAGVEERAEDFSSWEGDDRVDRAEAFGPGSAEELHEDGFGLVVEGMGGENAVGVAGGEEGGEEVIAGVASGLFDGLGVAIGSGFGNAVGDVGLVQVERDVEADAEVFDELLVGVGFFAAEVVVDVDGAEADAEGITDGGVGGVEGEEECYGIGTAGEGDADAVSGFDLCAVEGEGEQRH
jgi:hypothetical protein